MRKRRNALLFIIVYILIISLSNFVSASQEAQGPPYQLIREPDPEQQALSLISIAVLLLLLLQLMTKSLSSAEHHETEVFEIIMNDFLGFFDWLAALIGLICINISQIECLHLILSLSLPWT